MGTTNPDPFAEILRQYRVIITGKRRKRSYLIVVDGQTKKIWPSQLVDLLKIILAWKRSTRRAGGIFYQAAWKLRAVVGTEKIKGDADGYGLAFDPERVAIDPTFFDAFDDARINLEVLEDLCVRLTVSIVPYLLDREEENDPESEPENEE